MNAELDKELETALDKAVNETMRPPTLRPVPPKVMTLAEQWRQKEKIEQELVQRIRHEKMDIIAQHDKLWTEIKSDFERRIDFAVSKLETERRQALQALADQTAERVREHDLLMQRITRDIS